MEVPIHSEEPVDGTELRWAEYEIVASRAYIKDVRMVYVKELTWQDFLERFPAETLQYATTSHGVCFRDEWLCFVNGVYHARWDSWTRLFSSRWSDSWGRLLTPEEIWGKRFKTVNEAKFGAAEELFKIAENMAKAGLQIMDQARKLLSEGENNANK